MKIDVNADHFLFWEEEDLIKRNRIVDHIIFKVKETLKSQNKAWEFRQIDSPLLISRNDISNSYTNDDIFVTNHEKNATQICLRPETTKGSYHYAKYLLKNVHFKTSLPLCVYQMGKSFRRELSDGANLNRMRFNEFYQLEFQCIYGDTTKADVRQNLIDKLLPVFKSLLGGREVRVVSSDRVPEYASSTLDIEALTDDNKWREIVSCSIRNDYGDKVIVTEIAIGVDRLVLLCGKEGQYYNIITK